MARASASRGSRTAPANSTAPARSGAPARARSRDSISPSPLSPPCTGAPASRSRNWGSTGARSRSPRAPGRGASSRRARRVTSTSRRRHRRTPGVEGVDVDARMHDLHPSRSARIELARDGPRRCHDGARRARRGAQSAAITGPGRKSLCANRTGERRATAPTGTRAGGACSRRSRGRGAGSRRARGPRGRNPAAR